MGKRAEFNNISYLFSLGHISSKQRNPWFTPILKKRIRKDFGKRPKVLDISLFIVYPVRLF